MEQQDCNLRSKYFFYTDIKPPGAGKARIALPGTGCCKQRQKEEDMGTYQIGANAFNPNCVTGAADHFYRYLKEAISGAEQIDMNVSFLMVSGIKLVLDDLKTAAAKGVNIRILCGNYLNITQPEALYLLKGALGERLDLRFYNVPNHSFHAKAYFFKYPDYEEVFVGSSNLSKSALTNGIEWNYRLNSREHPVDCQFFRQTFEALLADHSQIIDDDALKKYSKQWVRPKIIQQLEESEDASEADSDGSKAPDRVAQGQADFIVDPVTTNPAPLIAFPQPTGAQVEALYELKNFRQENQDKGLIVAATGIGKTFLAAFDSKGFKRILFVAHREEILTQAEYTFKRVRYELSTGHINGTRKDSDADIIFASVIFIRTLSITLSPSSCWVSPPPRNGWIIRMYLPSATTTWFTRCG
jgi:HKD family nuclease